MMAPGAETWILDLASKALGPIIAAGFLALAGALWRGWKWLRAMVQAVAFVSAEQEHIKEILRQTPAIQTRRHDDLSMLANPKGEQAMDKVKVWAAKVGKA